MTLGLRGAVVFARIAAELNARRPEIPLLVVEGRGAAGGLARVKLDLSGPAEPAPAAQPPQPAGDLPDHAGVAGAVADARVVRAGGAGGAGQRIPVLASDRGALPETLGDAGFLFTIPNGTRRRATGCPRRARWRRGWRRSSGSGTTRRGSVAPGSGAGGGPAVRPPRPGRPVPGVLRVARP